MKRVIDLSSNDAAIHFLKGDSYFNADLPSYLTFEKILNRVSAVLNGGSCKSFQQSAPENHDGVNYSLIANKDGRLAWRPFELMHPAIYVSLINIITKDDNWTTLKARFSDFEKTVVDCCSHPIVSSDDQTDQAAGVMTWWQQVEQKSIIYSLDFTHILHTDVTDCYGSLYTHSICWAVHGKDVCKLERGQNHLIGNQIDYFVRAGRFGQTNGISQGSALNDFIAELVLGYVDELITNGLSGFSGFKILRYRDDYRVFTNNDQTGEIILKVISDCLRTVGMRLGVSKTHASTNVIGGAIKVDKLAGIELQDLGRSNAKTLQKQLLRLHAFGNKFPNSGALKRLLSEFHRELFKVSVFESELEVQAAILVDIVITSPSTFPVVAGILTRLMENSPDNVKIDLWAKIQEKLARVPYNGYQQIWMQRIVIPYGQNFKFESNEPVCKIVNGEGLGLWNNEWISSNDLKSCLVTSQIVRDETKQVGKVVKPSEVSLFMQNAFMHSG